MKERPCIMTPENGQKTHDGSKTNTRRLNGLDEVNAEPEKWTCEGINGKGEYVFWYRKDPGHVWRRGSLIKCPYGVVGDRLWIREACWIYGRWIPNHVQGKRSVGWKFQPGEIGRQVKFIKPLETEIRRMGDQGWGWVRRPAIHMPRWVCRTVVELTEICVERLNDITEADAEAEGCTGGTISGACMVTPRGEFSLLWDSIHGLGAWKKNPWVWSLKFRKVTA